MLASVTHILNTTQEYALLAFGFGFVIFFHELGHFLAAKYCDVKVEQFAVGFGPAIFAWRKGLGMRWGTTHRDYMKRLETYLDAQRANDPQLKEHIGAWTDQQLSRAGRELNLSDTEYRINWIPLGGYVKMLGQDDLRPDAAAHDPRAYNNKSIRARMVIVSAGVVMNIILAGIGFMVVYLKGWPMPGAIVGAVVSQSPAMKATLVDGSTPTQLYEGDEILTIDGHPTRNDFTKIAMWTALAEDGVPFDVVVRRHAANYTGDISSLKTETIHITPGHMENNPKGLLAIGIGQPFTLEGLDKNLISPDQDFDMAKLKDMKLRDCFALMPGDTITQINGQPVQEKEIWKLYDALAASDGKPVDITIKPDTGEIVHRQIWPHFQQAFGGDDDLNFAGLVPRPQIVQINEPSPALHKLFPGDVIAKATDPGHGDTVVDPDRQQLMKIIGGVGERNGSLTLDVISLDQAQPHQVIGLTANAKLDKGRKGLNVSLIGYDEMHTVVASVRKCDLTDKLKSGDTITAINDQPVSNWFQIRRIFADAKPANELTIHFTRPGEDKPQSTKFNITAEQIAYARTTAIVPFAGTDFKLFSPDRKTNKPWVAMGWGAIETRDLTLQFYITLHRMFTGGISAKNMMGPLGIFQAGAAFAAKGNIWLIWFLAMISANLAVVNFLPIPIVDGGLFTLLVLEKIQGKPLAPNTQRMVQYFGLALILGVFLMVTYQDIARMAGY